MKMWAQIIGLCLAVFTCKNAETVKNIESDAEVKSTSYNFTDLNDAKIHAGKIIRINNVSSTYIKPRPVDVWLPRSYTSNKKYSVLYMHDGQMLFDSTATWNNQEWKVDEWATQLMEANKTKDFIVVAIHNIPEIRWQDLFPQKAFDHIDDKTRQGLKDLSGSEKLEFNGDNYLKFLIDELKPIIDSSYSVHTDRDNTYIMGSSMGGLMSMYAISEYPEIFGAAACLSTHWPGAMPEKNNPYPDAIFKYMAENLPNPETHKLYFDYGNKTLDKHYPQYASKVDNILEAKGYTDKNSKNIFFKGTDHSENSWNQRLEKPLLFLLGK
ncbi:MAG: alpha/beta hydrolase [Winogradskyella sp.]|uniref:alpha/beta hydrolase n=1 Tax=Winogradskyella sp. TaxID=1883156 RepID=UPI00184EE3A5|nr:alpha/beta hydrolase [Winogradskyella sp.]